MKILLIFCLGIFVGRYALIALDLLIDWLTAQTTLLCNRINIESQLDAHEFSNVVGNNQEELKPCIGFTIDDETDDYEDEEIN